MIIVASKKKKPDYEEIKAIVTDFEGVKFSVITQDIETSVEGEGKIDALKGAFGLRGKKDTKKIVQAFVVSDPRIPTEGPVTQEIWEKYIGNLVLNEGKIKEHIAETVTIASGVTTTSTDVELRASFDVATTPPPYLWQERKTCKNCGETIIVTDRSVYCDRCGNNYQ